MINRFYLPIIALILLPLFILAYQFAIPAEDAVILYEYAKNLAGNGVITYGGAGTPIEGATDFLWMLCIAAFKRIGFPEFSSSLLLNFVGVIILIVLVKSRKAKFMMVMGLLTTAYLYSSLLGFSTIFFSVVYCWCLYLALNKKSGLYFSILILCLIRPDGVVWGAGLVLFRVLTAQEKIARKKEMMEFATHLLIPGLIYFLWRAWYFSEWLPLPFLVKASGHRDLFVFWIQSLKAVAIALIPALLTIFFVQDRGVYSKRLFIYFALPCLFYSVMQLEQNIGNRFLAPIFFGSMLLLSYEIKLFPLVAFAFVSALLSIPTTTLTIKDILDSADENTYYISRELSGLEGKMLVTEAGRLAYYSNWLTHDSWGLNTPKYAHNPITNSDLREGDYNLIVGHCRLNLLKQAVPEHVYENKTWENQCKVLISYVQSANYNVFLVPFLKENSSRISLRKFLGLGSYDLARRRYDLFAISPTYENSFALENLLTSHGGIRYSPSSVSFGRP